MEKFRPLPIYVLGLRRAMYKVAEFTESLGLYFSDFNIEDECINIDKSQIFVNGKYKKKEIELNGRDAPRGIKDGTLKITMR